MKPFKAPFTVLITLALFTLVSAVPSWAGYGNISTFAGGGSSYVEGAPASSVQLTMPVSAAYGPGADIYIADWQNVRKVNAAGTISTPWGNTIPASDMQFGPDGTLYLAVGQFLASIDPSGGIHTLAHFPNGFETQYVALDATATGLYFDHMLGGTINTVQRLDFATGTITTIAGQSGCPSQPTGNYSGDGIPAASANICAPQGLSVGRDGTLYVDDFYNNRIRSIDAQGIIHTVAGNGSTVFSGDGGLATAAGIGHAHAIALAPSGNLYFDNISNQVFEIHNGIIHRIAGTGATGFSGDGGPATSARFNTIMGIGVSPNEDRVFVADTNNNRIRVFAPPDYVAPVSTITTADGSQFVAAGSIQGTATDQQSGVSSVVVAFTQTASQSGNPSASATVTQTESATLSCNAGNHSCSWTADIPLVAGTYTVNVHSKDASGNVENPGPHISITVV